MFEIAEGDVLEFYISACDDGIGICTVFVCDIDVFVKNFVDTLAACHGTGGGHEHKGKCHQRHEDLVYIGEKLRKISHVHGIFSATHNQL